MGLPEVVVVGAQSSGKSSVLSEILGIRLPVSADLCTKFPIKIISRRSSAWSAHLKIIPDDLRDARSQAKISRHKIPIPSPEKLSDCIQRVAGILGVEHEDCFARDTVEVHLSSPFSPQVTLIDLPGVIEIPASESQTQEDVEDIKRMVTGYLDNPRCICLAVIDGAKDIPSNTILGMVTQEARAVRTICVLTKPDLIPAGKPLDRFLGLLKNENSLYQFPLGCHVVLNRSPKDTHLSQEEFLVKEKTFFEGTDWSLLSPGQKGLAGLSAGVTRQVEHFVASKIPHLLAEVQGHLSTLNAERRKLPDPVSTVEQATALLETGWSRLKMCLERVLVTPTSIIGQTSRRSGSGLVTSSTFMDTVRTLNEALLTSLLGAKVLQDSVALRETAKDFMRQFPPTFGEFPLHATIALYRQQTHHWHMGVHSYACELKAELHKCLREALAKHLADGLEDHMADQLASVTLDLFVEGDLCTLRSDVERQVEPLMFGPDSSHLLSASGEQNVRGASIFSAEFVESLRPLVEQRRRQFIRGTVSEKIGITDNSGPRLPNAVQCTFDVEALAVALEEALGGDVFTADDIVVAVAEQIKVRGVYCRRRARCTNLLSGYGSESLCRSGELEYQPRFREVQEVGLAEEVG